MADDVLNRTHSAQDRSRIDIRKEHEVRYWAEALHCTRDALVQTVRQVGVVAEDVRLHLAQQKYH